MSVKYENDRITGNTYENRKTLSFHGALWDKENKNWFVPETCDKTFIIKLVNAMNKNETITQKIWKQACDELGFKWVKKSTESYDKVKARFEKLLKQRKDIRSADAQASAKEVSLEENHDDSSDDE